MANEAGREARQDWRQALDALERGLRQSLLALEALRLAMVGGEPAGPTFVDQEEEGETSSEEQQAEAAAAPGPASLSGAHSPFERLWDRMEEKKAAEANGDGDGRRKGLAALPSQYLFTVEDLEGSADLVALHRGFQGMQGVRDISLMSFVNGVPIVAVNAEHELDLSRLGEVIGEATDRECDIMTQDGPKVHVRLRARRQGAA